MEILPVDEECAALLYKTLKLEGFFPELTAEQARKLFPRSALEKHPAEGSILRQGQPGRDLYIVVSGEVTVNQSLGSAGAEVSRLRPGDIFGEIALVKGGVRTAGVTAAVDSRVYRLSFADVQYLLENNLALGSHLQELARERTA